MIDFDALVAKSCVDVFSRPIFVRPVVSQPGALPYVARGIWHKRPIDVPTEQGIMSSSTISLGLRLSEFVIPVKPGDQIEIPAYMTLPSVGTVVVEDDDDDGEGMTVLSIKIIEQP